jgi:hypothetical protein
MDAKCSHTGLRGVTERVRKSPREAIVRRSDPAKASDKARAERREALMACEVPI